MSPAECDTLQRRRHSCIVLGAGHAELAAGPPTQVKMDGEANIVEARERLSGRVFSHSFDERPIA
jgi:hypothetical protein